MPDDIAGGYDPVGDMWVSSEESETEIKAGCGVRLRIIGVTVGAELVRPHGALCPPPRPACAFCLPPSASVYFCSWPQWSDAYLSPVPCSVFCFVFACLMFSCSQKAVGSIKDDYLGLVSGPV